MEIGQEIVGSFKHPTLSRGGTYANPFPDIDLSCVNTLPIYTSRWTEEIGRTELNTFLASYNIMADDHDIYFNEVERNVSFFRYDFDLQFCSSYKSLEVVNPIKFDSDISSEIELPSDITYTLSSNGKPMFSVDVKKQISENITSYLNSHEDLFGHVNETVITTTELSRSSNALTVELKSSNCSDNVTDIILDYFGFLDNLDVTLHYDFDNKIWNGMTITRYSRERFAEVGEYSIIPYSEAFRRFRENDTVNYTRHCDYETIKNCDVYLIYIMDSNDYIRPIYVCTSADFIEYDNAFGSFAWIDAIIY